MICFQTSAQNFTRFYPPAVVARSAEAQSPRPLRYPYMFRALTRALLISHCASAYRVLATPRLSSLRGGYFAQPLMSAATAEAPPAEPVEKFRKVSTYLPAAAVAAMAAAARVQAHARAIARARTALSPPVPRHRTMQPSPTRSTQCNSTLTCKRRRHSCALAGWHARAQSAPKGWLRWRLSAGTVSRVCALLSHIS